MVHLSIFLIMNQDFHYCTDISPSKSEIAIGADKLGLYTGNIITYLNDRLPRDPLQNNYNKHQDRHPYGLNIDLYEHVTVPGHIGYNGGHN